MTRRRTLTGYRKEGDRNRSLMNDDQKRRKQDQEELYLYRYDINFKMYAENFEIAQKNLNFEVCNVCHRRWFDLQINKADNKMDPGLQHDVLKK